MDFIEEGHKYIFPQRYEAWDTYVLKIKSEAEKGAVKRALRIMSSMEENPTKENILNIAQQTYSQIDGILLLLVRGLVFNFSKIGPEFCLALESVKASFEEREFFKDETTVPIKHGDIDLLLQRMVENRKLQQELEQTKTQTI